MGAAIHVMHYTAMAAVTFTPSADRIDLSNTLGVSYVGIVGIGLIAIVVLGVVIGTSTIDRLQKAAADLRCCPAHTRWRQLESSKLASAQCFRDGGTQGAIFRRDVARKKGDDPPLLVDHVLAEVPRWKMTGGAEERIHR